MRYRTKPFEIEAVQYTGLESVGEIFEVFPDIQLEVGREVDAPALQAKVYDYLQETWVTVNLNDYIIKGMKGEYYPCDPEVFETKYEVYI